MHYKYAIYWPCFLSLRKRASFVVANSKRRKVTTEAVVDRCNLISQPVGFETKQSVSRTV